MSTTAYERASLEFLHNVDGSDRDYLTEYLSHYLKPILHEKDGVRCVCCDRSVFSGEIIDAFLATFTWGLAHGEGHCRNCGWHYRMYHFLKLPSKGGKEIRWVFPLAHIQYEDEEHTREMDPTAASEEARDDG